MINNLNYLKDVASALSLGEELPLQIYPLFHMYWRGKVVPKERPRHARGHTYTPKATKDFEAEIKEAAEAIMIAHKLSSTKRPIAAELVFFDVPPSSLSSWHKQLIDEHYIFSTAGGDLDNKEKAVMDALNGVFYYDDRQLVRVDKRRAWHTEEGFDLTLTPIGLTPNEPHIIARFMGVKV